MVTTELVGVKTDKNEKVNVSSPYASGGASTNNDLTNTDYTTYFLTSAKNQGVSLANQKTSASALGNNYMLYLANLNSLIKEWANLEKTLIPI